MPDRAMERRISPLGSAAITSFRSRSAAIDNCNSGDVEATRAGDGEESAGAEAKQSELEEALY